MPKRRVIAIDCDDVLVETSPFVVDDYNKRFGTNLGMKDMYSGDLLVWQTKSDEEAIDRIEEYLKTDEFQQIAPFKEAIESIKRLAQYHELHVVTGRSSFLTEATESMLERYFHGMFSSVEHTGMFGAHARSKGDVCVDIGADLLIDDHLHHAKQVAQRDIDVLLFGNYPWNQAKSLPKHIRRVQDWAEVEKLLL